MTTSDDDSAAWTVEDEAALRRANSRWRCWQVWRLTWFNYGLEWRSWAIYFSLNTYALSGQVGPFLLQFRFGKGLA